MTYIIYLGKSVYHRFDNWQGSIDPIVQLALNTAADNPRRRVALFKRQLDGTLIEINLNQDFT